jgi:hypothetical protein
MLRSNIGKDHSGGLFKDQRALLERVLDKEDINI